MHFMAEDLQVAPHRDGWEGGGNLKSSFLISTPIAYQSWTRSETLRSTDITGGGLKSTTFLSTPTLGD